MVETIQIALFGTFLSAIISFFAGILAAENITPRYINRPVKWLLAMLRGIPVILLALLFVSTVGLGPFPGVLAIALHSTGMLGKFYSEAMENAQIGPIEALESAGANFVQKIRFGILSQVAPDLARDTLFTEPTFEIPVVELRRNESRATSSPPREPWTIGRSLPSTTQPSR